MIIINYLFFLWQASLHPKDEESEQQTATLVESALSLYNSVGEIFKQSTRAGGYVSILYYIIIFIVNKYEMIIILKP